MSVCMHCACLWNVPFVPCQILIFFLIPVCSMTDKDKKRANLFLNIKWAISIPGVCVNVYMSVLQLRVAVFCSLCNQFLLYILND